MYWYIGIAMGFLEKLYLATGKQTYLATAKDLFTFVRRCAEDRTRTFASGKLGWGSAVLYHITGDRKCASMAEKTANYLIEVQNRDGSWGDSSIQAELIYDLTAEMALWLAEYDRELVKTRPIA